MTSNSRSCGSSPVPEGMQTGQPPSLNTSKKPINASVARTSEEQQPFRPNPNIYPYAGYAENLQLFNRMSAANNVAMASAANLAASTNGHQPPYFHNNPHRQRLIDIRNHNNPPHNSNGLVLPEMHPSSANSSDSFRHISHFHDLPRSNNLPQFPGVAYQQSNGGNLFMNGHEASTSSEPAPIKTEEKKEKKETNGSEECESTGEPDLTYGPGDQFRQIYQLGPEPDRKEVLDDLFAFMQAQGTPINRVPIMAKQLLDLFKLFKLVVGRGGVLEVVNKKLWRDVTKDLELPSTITSAAFTLRTQYCRFLYPYECHKYHFSVLPDLQAAIDNNKREGKKSAYVFDVGQGGVPLHLLQQSAMANVASINNLVLPLNPRTGLPQGLSPQLTTALAQLQGLAGLPFIPNLPHVRHPHLMPPHLTGDFQAPPGFINPEGAGTSAFTARAGQRRSSPDSFDGSTGSNKRARADTGEAESLSSKSPEGRGSRNSPPTPTSLMSIVHRKDSGSNEGQMAVVMTINGVEYEGILKPKDR